MQGSASAMASGFKKARKRVALLVASAPLLASCGIPADEGERVLSLRGTRNGLGSEFSAVHAKFDSDNIVSGTSLAMAAPAPGNRTLGGFSLESKVGETIEPAVVLTAAAGRTDTSPADTWPAARPGARAVEGALPVLLAALYGAFLLHWSISRATAAATLPAWALLPSIRRVI